MWIPTHYVCLFVAILLLESSALFVYTLIGLMKSNPVPWAMPPPPPDLSICRSLQDQQFLGGQPQEIARQTDLQPASTVVVTMTTTAQQVLGLPSSISQSSGSQLSALASVVAGISGAFGADAAAAASGQGSTATDTSTASGGSSAGATNATPTATSTAVSTTGSGGSPTGSSTSPSSTPSGPTSASVARPTVIETVHIPASEPPRSTSTSVVVVAAPTSTK